MVSWEAPLTFVLSSTTALLHSNKQKQKKKYEKVIKLLTKETGSASTAERLRLDLSDIKAAIVALQWILTNGAKYRVDEGTLSTELQQLGLPKGTKKEERGCVRVFPLKQLNRTE